MSPPKDYAFMGCDFSSLEVEILSEILRRGDPVPPGLEGIALDTETTGLAPGRTPVIHIHDEYIVEVDDPATFAKDLHKRLSRLVGPEGRLHYVTSMPEFFGALPQRWDHPIEYGHHDQADALRYAIFGEDMSAADDKRLNTFIPPIAPLPGGVAPDFKNETLGEPVRESREVRELRASNRNLQQTNAGLYQQIRELTERNREMRRRLCNEQADANVSLYDTNKELKERIKWLEEKNLELEKNRFFTNEMLVSDADTMLRFLAGLNLQDHPIADQRRQRDIVQQMLVTLRKKQT